MKFGRYLKDHAIDEWRKAYVNYRQLKKQIVKAQAELQELDEAAEAEQQASPVSEATEPDLERGERSSHHNDDDHDDDDRAGLTGNKSVPEPPTGNKPSLHVTTDADFASQRTGADTREVDRADSDGTNAPLVSSPGARSPSVKSRTGPAPYGTRLRDRFPRRQSSFKLTKSGDFNPKRLRPGFSNSMPLEQLLEMAPPCSRRFFTLLDRELERVSSFYGDRERDAVVRFQELSEQWKELQDHKKEFQELRAREAPLFPIMNRVPPTIPGSRLIRRGLAGSGTRTGSAAQSNGRENLSEYAARQNGSQQPMYRHGRPEEYQNARSKLKLATFEYYRSLGMLKSYRVLNRTGFAKAQKKFEKSTRIPCQPWSYKVDQANFVASTKLDELIRGTEDAFASVFEHGDRKKALERLRDFGQSKRHHFTAWRAGVYMGIAAPLFIEGIVQSCKASTRAEIPYWEALLQLFGAMFLPVLFTLLFFLNLVSWAGARINYILIFELDVRTRLDLHQFIEIPALLLCILCLFFWASFNNFWPDQIAPSVYPLAFLVVTLLLLLMPLPILYPSARWWMLRTFCRVVTAGLIAVQFSDFFLGDELNSLYYSISNLGLLYCAYNHSWPSDTYQICSLNKTWTTPILASLPAFWRFGQSIRRYIDSDGLIIHMLNAGKYTASIVQFWFYYSWRIYGSSSTARKALWIFSAVLNSSYTASWDIVMDWSLLRRGSKNRLLRNELGYFKDRKWMYYVAIVFDVVLRFSWVIYLTDKGPSLQLKGFLVALIEAIRRIVWNAFRVESEHIGNVDGYRVTRNVPLPYISAVSAPPRDDDDDLRVLRTRKQAFFDFLHNLHRSIVKDFSPLANISLLPMSTSSGRGTKGHRARSKSMTEGGKSRGTAPETSSDEDGDADSDDDSHDRRDSDDELDDGAGEDGLAAEVQQADRMMQQGGAAGMDIGDADLEDISISNKRVL